MSTPSTPIETICSLYNISPAHLRSLPGGHFSEVYQFTDHGMTYVLRITPPNDDIDLSAMQSIHEWLAFLAAQGGPVPRPLRSRSGNLIEVVPAGDQIYLAGAAEKAPGVLAEGMLPQDWSDDLFQALGRTVGQCHQIAMLYHPPAGFQRPDWDCLQNCFNPLNNLAMADPWLLEKRSHVLSIIQQMPKAPPVYGLAHMDLHFGNFFIDRDNQQVTLFDFDDCAYGWYIMDIAMLLFDVLVVYDQPDRQQFGDRFLTNVLRGYIPFMPDSAFWVEQLPHFLKLLELSIFMSFYRDGEPAADGWLGKFFRGRKERILNDVPYVDLDFPKIYRNSEISVRAI
jgi:Ser/Thr protein kinase RdoA (MazF antagonist)